MSATALELENIRPALTQLSEEEELFRSSIREFAEGEIRPRLEKMEHEAKLDKELIKQCFELGLMAIETPEEYGGAGSSFFNAIIAIEELARVDASTSVFCRCAKHTCDKRDYSLGKRRFEEKISAANGNGKSWRICFERSRKRFRCFCFENQSR